MVHYILRFSVSLSLKQLKQCKAAEFYFKDLCEFKEIRRNKTESPGLNSLTFSNLA